jgi:hypothetical protein
MKITFKELYWNKCYNPIYNGSIISEHKTMCATFKKMLKHELCNIEIKSTIKKCVKSHIEYEKTEHAKSRYFTNKFGDNIYL